MARERRRHQNRRAIKEADSRTPLPQRKNRSDIRSTRRHDLQNESTNDSRHVGMATALSIDHYYPPPASKCVCEDAPSLSVNFLCMHPRCEEEEDKEDHGKENPGNQPPPHKPTAARFQEIFLDLTALHTASLDASSRHVLDERFDSFLGPGERSFKRSLLRALEDMEPMAKDTAPYRTLERMARVEMGYGGLDVVGERRVRMMRDLRGDSREIDRVDDGPNEQTVEDSAAENVEFAARVGSIADGDEQDKNFEGERSAGAKTLQELMSVIRSDATIHRLFALSHPDRDKPPTEKQMRRLVSSVPRANDCCDDDADGEILLPPNEDRRCRFFDADKIMNLLSDPALRAESHSVRSLLRPPGHVFVTNASVCDISCDAFLCPGQIMPADDSIHGRIWGLWYTALKEHNAELHARLTASSGRKGRMKLKRYGAPNERVATLKDWPWSEFQTQVGGGTLVEDDNRSSRTLTPAPFLVAGEVSLSRSRLDTSLPAPLVGIRRHHETCHYDAPTEEQHLDSLMETVRQFIAVSMDELHRHQPEPFARRDRYLLALPVVGTGGGLAGDLTGQVVERMLRLLCKLVSETEAFDCVLVCADEATYSHAQSVRSKLVGYQYDAVGGGLPLPRRVDRIQSPTVVPKTGSFPLATQLATEEEEEEENTAAVLLPCFRLLTPRLRQSASRIAEMASRGHLSLFLGAGVSIGSGVPGWFDLLLAVEDQFTPTGDSEERTLGDDTSWDPLAMADRLDEMASTRPDRSGTRQTLKKRICSLIVERARRPGLLLSLLSSLPCKSVVTQNYDRLIERAHECRNASEWPRNKGRRRGHGNNGAVEGEGLPSLSVIPYRPVPDAERWLLKMHGCVTAPDEIVITGADYDAYEAGRMRALAGLVQANLMTTHLLFVGYSMSDPNYLRIVEEVRNALRPVGASMSQIT